MQYIEEEEEEVAGSWACLMRGTPTAGVLLHVHWVIISRRWEQNQRSVIGSDPSIQIPHVKKKSVAVQWPNPGITGPKNTQN